MMKVFVSRVYTVAQYGFTRLDEEKVFAAHDQALDFLKRAFFEEECDASFLKEYFAEIVEYDVSQSDMPVSTTRFDCLGDGFVVPQDTDKRRKVDKDFVPRFKAGDIVTLKQVKGKRFNFFNDTLGVVTGVPSTFAERKEKLGFADENWVPVFMVEFIGETGFLSHAHPLQEEMSLYENELPAELVVLGKISEHFKKERFLDDELINAMRQGKIYLLNVRTMKDVDWG